MTLLAIFLWLLHSFWLGIGALAVLVVVPVVSAATARKTPLGTPEI